MYSRARIAGHPVHPMLVALPIGLYVTTVGALVAHVATGDAFYYRAAALASTTGVIAALVTAIPGAIDLFSLARGSRARVVGMKHASLALLATGLFAVCAALLWRGEAGTADARLALGIAIAGLTALAAVGWLGWSLVQTHHVGIAPTIVETPREEVAIAPDVLRTPAGPSQLHAYRH
jgi:uncharacterized membrane protein